MKRYVLLFLGFLALQSCNDGSNNSNSTNDSLKDPSVMQPPSDAITDSTKIVNDSVIVPDTTPGNGRAVGSSDSIQRNR